MSSFGIKFASYILFFIAIVEIGDTSCFSPVEAPSQMDYLVESRSVSFVGHSIWLVSSMGVALGSILVFVGKVLCLRFFKF